MAYSNEDRIYDQLLLLHLKRGDRKAADRLAARWQPRLLRTARRLLQDPEQAREVVQEAWSGICKGWHRVREPERFPAWAYRILHNKCADRIRLEQKQRQRMAPLEHAPEPSISARGEDRLAIIQAFDQLGADQKLAAILYFSEGLTAPEIASVTDAPVGTVKSRLFHARKHLKSLLKGDNDE